MNDPEHPPARRPDGAAERERSGPLILERHRKADGRLLILYRAAGDEPSEGVEASEGVDATAAERS